MSKTNGYPFPFQLNYKRGILHLVFLDSFIITHASQSVWLHKHLLPSRNCIQSYQTLNYQNKIFLSYFKQIVLVIKVFELLKYRRASCRNKSLATILKVRKYYKEHQDWEGSSTFFNKANRNSVYAFAITAIKFR